MAISLNDFNNLTQEEMKETLQNLKAQIGVSGIVNAWGISRSKVYGMLNDLNIPLNPRGRKTSKTSASGEKKTAPDKQVSAETAKGKKNGKPKTKQKHITPESSLDFDMEEVNDSKFSLYLETEGSASFISEAVQMLLAANKFTSANMHVNITLKEI